MDYELNHNSTNFLPVLTYEQLRTIFADHTYPLAFVDLDALDNNIRLHAGRAGDKHIRVASKSIRCPEVMRRVLDYGPSYRGIMAYHGREALWLAEAGFDNILLGYPVVDRVLLREIGKQIGTGKDLVLMVDSAVHLQLLNELGRELDVVYPVCVDLDLSVDFGPLHFGVWRSPLRSVADLAELVGELKKQPFVRLEGLMGYEAQIAGLGDEVPGLGWKNAVIRRLKKLSLPIIRRRRAEAVELLRAEGFPPRFVNGGGTGSLESTREEAVVTEITVGSGFFASHLFDYYRGFQARPALAYGVQIVRQPKAGIFTAHGGGYIASGGLDASKAPRVFLPAGARLDPNEGAGEVQTPIHYQGDEPLQIGDPIFLRHAKAGELCEHFDELLLLRGDAIVGRAKTYRGLW